MQTWFFYPSFLVGIPSLQHLGSDGCDGDEACAENPREFLNEGCLGESIMDA